MKKHLKTMRDAFIERLSSLMELDDTIMFLTADLGAPSLDVLRAKFPKKFLNVGIAEQNLVNLASGLALEGYKVFAYGIASFLVMRAYEQIRNNVSMLSQFHDLNINLMGLGAGLSYNIGGPTHQSLEDIVLMMTLPNIMTFSPSDSNIVRSLVDYCLDIPKPKYFRLDGHPLPNIYSTVDRNDISRGFKELVTGEDICLVSTGFMTHVALEVSKALGDSGIKAGVLDIYLLKPFNEDGVGKILKRYNIVITLEEAFINKGGLDCTLLRLIYRLNPRIRFLNLGYHDNYLFEIGTRDFLHKKMGLAVDDLISVIQQLYRSQQ